MDEGNPFQSFPSDTPKCFREEKCASSQTSKSSGFSNKASKSSGRTKISAVAMRSFLCSSRKQYAEKTAAVRLVIFAQTRDATWKGCYASGSDDVLCAFCKPSHLHRKRSNRAKSERF